MHVQFERREHRVPASNRRVELRAAVVNNDGRLDGLTYDVTIASDPAVEVRWGVSGPSSLERGQNATIVVTLQLPASASRHPALTVRLTVTDAGGRSPAMAETFVYFGDDRCAAFSEMPRLTLSPDGSVTASLVLVNCGPFKISLRVSARRGDGSTLTIDRPEITLTAGGDPIPVTSRLWPSNGRPVSEHEQIHLELSSDGMVLASTQAGVSAAVSPPPPRRRRTRRVRSAAGAVLVLALVIVVIAKWPRPSPPDGDGTVPPQLPDLVVTDITNSGVTVSNVGDGPAGSFVILINGEAFDSGGLADGESEQISVDLCEGNVDVVVDPRNAVAEIDEKNNEASDSIVC